VNTVAVPHIADMGGDGLAVADHSNADVRFCISGPMGRRSAWCVHIRCNVRASFGWQARCATFGPEQLQ
jgi:hypothetical protein